ncbi:TetR/AcrR family transcriptional regulator [Aliamphritea spongicola]|uniref:TetR/AcrR family transcriptional regulator n=1 Tax=Aliamphritea spongicola TaxID=707589 RepID=UPI00196AA197|nr:TetR/AcrR family transcriptional regulator [Aliamphritea spongicola]MBN3561020.1 TetR/AcrR family transcriptional regulator [Aliamphritea spongicola]
MGKIEQNKEKKRRAILQAAQEVFLSEGFVQAGMDKIAAQAQVTKQTVYRYFPSKTELFKATLQYMGESSEPDVMAHLTDPDTEQALHNFALGFLRFHMTDVHLATFRLLVAEGGKAPEMTATFREVGPDDTSARLEAFFRERMGLSNAGRVVRLWTGMLLSLRGGVLMGMARPDDAEIEQHARSATEFMLAAVAAERAGN